MTRVIAYQRDEWITEWDLSDKTAEELVESLRSGGKWCIIPLHAHGGYKAILVGSDFHFTIEDTP